MIVNDYDFKSDHPGSNREGGGREGREAIYYEAFSVHVLVTNEFGDIYKKLSSLNFGGISWHMLQK